MVTYRANLGKSQIKHLSIASKSFEENSTIKVNMGNSESHSPNDHEDRCKEAENKLEECVLAHFNPKMEEIGTKLSIKGYKATFHDEDDKLVYYLKRGACKESVTAFVEGPDRDKHGTMRECMEAHSNYYHKYLSMCQSIDKQIKEEIESIYPFVYVEDRDTAIIDHHEALTDGDCCKEQYAAYKGCCLRSRRSS
ncbi:hypothetical protein Bca4012_067475 [Brassica carinata]